MTDVGHRKGRLTEMRPVLGVEVGEQENEQRPARVWTEPERDRAPTEGGGESRSETRHQ